MKDIYELLNDIDIHEFEEAEVNDLEKQKIKQSIKKNLSLTSKKTNKNYKKIVAAALILFSIVSLSFSQDVLAKGIQLLGELFQQVYGNNSNFEKYSDIIDRTISQDGIDVTFNSAVISNDTMVLDFTVKNNNEKITKDNIHEALVIPDNLKINNKNISTSAGANYEQIDDNTIRIVKDVDIGTSDYTAKGLLNVEIIIDNLFGEKDNFNFKFKYDKTEQDDKSISKEINKTMELNNNKLDIESLSLSPLTSSIHFTSYDDGVFKKSNFIAIDNNNNILKFKGLHGTGSISKKYTNTSLSFLCNEDTKSVTFIPCAITENSNYEVNNNFKTIDLNSKNIELNITDDLGILIKDIDVDNNFLIVKYNTTFNKSEGDLHHLMPIDLKLNINNSIQKCISIDDELFDSLNTKYSSKNRDYSVSIFKLDNENINSIDLGIDLEYNVEFFKDKSITLDLPN